MTLSKGLWYLATPYSKYPGGMVEAFHMAAKAAAYFIKEGWAIYCPIAHTHPIAVHGDMDQTDHNLWLTLDKYFMDRCDGMIFLQAESWELSKGMQFELEYFRDAKKPIIRYPWPIEEEV